MTKLNFTGNGFEYFKIWIVNILLTIITLGIYYPWAKVRNNKYLYANSTMEENNFDYHATGKQLFLGYVIALVLFIAYNILGQIFPILSVIFLVALFIAIPWLIYRTMKFNLKVTSFSNVRFEFDGKIKGSYIVFFAYPILFIILFSLSFIVLGFFGIKDGVAIGVASLISIFIYIYSFAFISAKKTTYLINSSKYGQGSFKTDIKISDFLIILLKTFGISILTLIASGIVIAGLFYALIYSPIAFAEVTKDPLHIQMFIQQQLPFFIFSYILLVFFSFIAIAYYKTKQREYIFKNTTFDEKITFESTLKFTKLAYIMTTNFLMIVLTLGLAIPWAKVRVMKYYLENTLIQAEDLSAYISQVKKESAIGEEIGDTFDIDVAVI